MLERDTDVVHRSAKSILRGRTGLALSLRFAQDQTDGYTDAGGGVRNRSRMTLAVITTGVLAFGQTGIEDPHRSISPRADLNAFQVSAVPELSLSVCPSARLPAVARRRGCA